MIASKLVRNSCAVAVSLVLAPMALADYIGTLDFVRVTSNSAVNIAPQLKVDVYEDVGDYPLRFVVKNNGAGADTSNIHEIYFYGGSYINTSPGGYTMGDLLGTQGNKDYYKGAAGSSSTDVAYTDTASPDSLSGWDGVITPTLKLEAIFGADSTGGLGDGVEAGERFAIAFKYASAVNIGTVKDAFANDLFKIGLHVGGLAGGKSDSFVSDGPIKGDVVVPLPASVWAGMVMLGGMFLLKINGGRRRIA